MALAATAGALTVSAVVVIGSAPAAWWLLGICAVVVLAVLVVALGEGRFFEPLTVLAAFSLAAFVLRPLYLFLYSNQLISFTPPVGASTVQSLLRLDNSELALFATTKLHGPLQPALTRAIGACAVFIVVFVAAYITGLGQRCGRRLATAGSRRDIIDVRTAVGLALGIGLIGQAGIVVKTGGLTKAANSQLHQTALQAGLVLYILAGFAIVAILVWAAWMPPKTRPQRFGLLLITLEVCMFFALVGSRTHVLAMVLTLVVVTHYRWRRLRLRHVLTAFAIGIVLTAALLGVRQATSTQSFTSSLGSAPAYIEDPRGLINNITPFDELFYATSAIGVTLRYKHGGWILDAVRSYIPHFLDSSKPQPPDIVFRRDIFGDQLKAGRPPTVVGDLYFDFGFAGVAVGAALIGLVAPMLLGLLSDADAPGRPFRITLYASSLFVFYELVAYNYAIAINYFLTLVVPLLLTVFLFGRLRLRAPGRLVRVA